MREGENMGDVIKVPYCGVVTNYVEVINLGVKSKIGDGGSMYVGRINRPLVKYAMINNGGLHYELFACLSPVIGDIAYSANDASGVWVERFYTESINGNMTFNNTVIYYSYEKISDNIIYSYPETFGSLELALNAMNNGDWSDGDSQYPITYHYTNSTVTGPSSAAVGDTVTVSAVPNAGYGITDASTQILVTNNDVAVPYTWNAATNVITFTMPDPS